MCRTARELSGETSPSSIHPTEKYLTGPLLLRTLKKSSKANKLIHVFCREFEFSFPLKNLKPSTNYEVRADIKKTSLLSSLHFVGYVKNVILYYFAG
jgi:hypothetical protein